MKSNKDKTGTDLRVVEELAPKGALRAGINLSNFLLVSDRDKNGNPIGVSPDIAKAIAGCLGVEVQYICYESPADLADACDHNEWDIGNIGAEPQRAEKIVFSPAYCEIEATYLVQPNSTIESLSDVDRSGIRISVRGGSAYGLWLERNIREAELIFADSLDKAFDNFVEQKLEVLAGLKPRLLQDLKSITGARIVDGKFSAVQQAIGTPRRNTASAVWLKDFVEDAKQSGLVSNLINKHNVKGLSVAPQSS